MRIPCTGLSFDEKVASVNQGGIETFLVDMPQKAGHFFEPVEKGGIDENR